LTNYRAASNEEVSFFEQKLEDYNLRQKPLEQDKAFITFQHVAEEEGEIVGGILAYSSYYKIGYIDTLWVDEKSRQNGIGSILLKQAEMDLHQVGCQIIQLSTFDFQGPDFYRKQGYEEFGHLYYPNADLNEVYLKKELLNETNVRTQS